jgi:ABC-type antimicrobial peptide transport system permease subunit
MAALKRFAVAYLRNPAAGIGLLLLIAIIIMALTADWFFPRDPLALAGRPLQWPGANPRFLLGTDNSGRDIAAQVFHGARVSLLIGLVATSIAVVIGIVIGALLTASIYGLVNMVFDESSAPEIPQDILAQRGFSPTNIKRKPLPAGLDINIINSAQMLAEGQKWQALWRDTVTRGARG